MAIENRSAVSDLDDEDEDVPIHWLTDMEALAMLDKQARFLLQMSGEEFLVKWRADAFSEEFKDEHHSAFVFLSLMALPFGR